jgi:plastocyanin
MQDMQAGQIHEQSSNSLIVQAPVSTATVLIEDFQFRPNNLVLKKGGKVTFINKDSAPHTATPQKGAQFTGTGRLKKNESKTVVFNTLGVQNYFCEIHPSMKGKITVQ